VGSWTDLPDAKLDGIDELSDFRFSDCKRRHQHDHVAQRAKKNPPSAGGPADPHPPSLGGRIRHSRHPVGHQLDTGSETELPHLSHCGQVTQPTQFIPKSFDPGWKPLQDVILLENVQRR